MRGEHYREVVVADILDFREQSQSFEDITAWGLDSRGVVFNVRPFDQFVADAVAPRRFNLWLFSAFGFLAALLAAAGIYAIMDFAVVQRKREIGIRVALGAQKSAVMKLILGEDEQQSIRCRRCAMSESGLPTRTMMKYFFLIVATSLLMLPATSYAKISNTNELVVAMQKKYGKSWYKTATFVQETTNIQPDGTSKVETWYEAMSVPGSLRIDFTPIKEGNGVLFTDGKIFVFKDGKVDSTRPFDHPLLILGFDIYRAPASEVTTRLQALKFDIAQFREDTWQGRPVYVVGAKAGDLHSPQFWIDQENLYFVRMLRPTGKDGTQTSEVQFNKYQKLGGGWIAPEVIFMVDGKVVTTEKYSDMRADVKLDPKLFDPQFWTTVHWKE